ncbi:tetratricopeptide repeat protein [Inhella crocodyli]|uniref:Sel1 repeat family protein n=1 Tax=Inhella crocodyli TaxID=2499851 RepID=A0A437LE86_9BURK|nr:tetratricopeptide repeat protein [Inhella crocodyli]RVT83680.1 sel1 repeat family protein [Inhella crocodyli]
MPRSPIRRFASFALIVGPLLSACSTVPLGDEVDPATVRPTAAIYAPEDLRGLDVPALQARGDASAFNELGRRYGLGLGVAKDSVQSKAHYQRAAELGLAMGQCNLAFMHLQGEGTPKNTAEAVRWYRACAAQGHYVGARALGSLYARGDAGLPRDGRRAEAWYLLAARQGHVPAQEALVTMYSQGLPGLSPDPVKAAVWKHRVRDAVLFNSVWKDLP